MTLKPVRSGRRHVLRAVALLLLVAFLAIQFVRPQRSNPSVDARLTLDAIATPPADVAQILAEACADCHSHTTRWPWYSNLAPVSWWVTDDVRHGREHFNLSLLGEEAPDDQVALLREAAKEVKKESMPLQSYTWTHPKARLSKEQRELLSSWFEETSKSLESGAGQRDGGKKKAPGHDHGKHEHR